MKILIACEFSGIVRESFAKKGHDVWSCDLLDTDIPGKHIKGDVLEILDDGWDMMIAHPPCTYLANSGVRWLYERQDRWQMMIDAAEFFKILLNANIPKICVENPVPHKYAMEIIGQRYTQIIQPYEYGEDASKKTCLWLKSLPKLKPTKYIEPKISSVGKKIWGNQTKGGWNKLSPSFNRWKIRSRTYQGIAEAMAEQWSKDLQQDYF